MLLVTFVVLVGGIASGALVAAIFAGAYLAARYGRRPVAVEDVGERVDAAEQRLVEAKQRLVKHQARLDRALESLQDKTFDRMKVSMLDAQLLSVTSTGEGFAVAVAPGPTMVVDMTDVFGQVERVSVRASPEDVEEPLVFRVDPSGLDVVVALEEWHGTEVSCIVSLDRSSGLAEPVELVSSSGKSLVLPRRL